MKNFLRKFRGALLALPFVGVSAMAEGSSYTVPSGVTQAINDAKAAADGLAGVAIPAVAYIALAFVGITIVWLIVKAVRRGAK